jgi:hypothetical protein
MTAAEHTIDCGWHLDQYPWECTCGVIQNWSRRLRMMEWQPIETAPKDGTVVLLFCPASWDTNGVRVAFWYPGEVNPPDGAPDGDAGWYDDETGSHPMTLHYEEPTHWMPIPDPPKQEIAE